MFFKTKKLESKEKILRMVDLENKSPCDLCWENARDNGIYCFPLTQEGKNLAKRCKNCNRII